MIMLIDSFKRNGGTISLSMVGFRKMIISNENEQIIVFEDGERALAFWGKLKSK